MSTPTSVRIWMLLQRVIQQIKTGMKRTTFTFYGYTPPESRMRLRTDLITDGCNTKGSSVLLDN